MRCIVIEDEPKSRAWLCARLREFEEVTLVGDAASVQSAYQLILRMRPEAMFLDVKLIGGSAFNLLELLRRNNLPIPWMVVVTGSDEHAKEFLINWRAYVVDYLTKPVAEDWREKLQRSLNALMAAISQQQVMPAPVPVTENDFIFIESIDEGINKDASKDENNAQRNIRIDFDNLIWIEVAGEGHVTFFTANYSHRVRQTLVQILNVLPDKFIRISRQAAVNIDKVVRLENSPQNDEIHVYVSNGKKDSPLKVGDTYYRSLAERLRIF